MLTLFHSRRHSWPWLQLGSIPSGMETLQGMELNLSSLEQVKRVQRSGPFMSICLLAGAADRCSSRLNTNPLQSPTNTHGSGDAG